MASRADKRLLKSVVDLDLVDFFSDEEFDPADYVKTFYEQRGASQAASRSVGLDASCISLCRTRRGGEVLCGVHVYRCIGRGQKWMLLLLVYLPAVWSVGDTIMLRSHSFEKYTN